MSTQTPSDHTVGAAVARLIRTEHVYPPVPFRDCDWSAVFDDSYEPGQPIGRGASEAEAIADLLIESDYQGAVSIQREAV